MAEPRLKIILDAVDNVSHTLKGISSAAEDNSRQLKVAGAVATGFGLAIVGALALATKAAAAEEAGIMRLAKAMSNVGISYAEVRQELEAVIDATQQKTAVADDEQRKALSELIGITGNYQRSLGLLPLALDMAAGKEMDLSIAAQTVGRVSEGNTSILGRYGIQLKEGATATEALTALTAKYGGQAEAFGKTVAGQMQLVKSNLGDVSEAIGKTFLPLVSKAAEGLNSLAQRFKDLSPATQGFIAISGAAAAAVSLFVGSFLLFLGFLPSILAGLASLTKALAAIRAALLGITAAKMAVIAELVALSMVMLGLSWAATQAARAFTNLIVSLSGRGTKQELQSFTDYLSDLVGLVFGPAIGAFEKLGQTISPGLKGSIDDVLPSLDDLRTSVVETTSDVLDTMGLWGVALVEHQERIDDAIAATIMRRQNRQIAAEEAAQVALLELSAKASMALIENQQRIDDAIAASIMRRQNQRDQEQANTERAIELLRQGWERIKKELDPLSQAFRSTGLTITETIRGWAEVTGKTVDDIINSLINQGFKVEDLAERWLDMGIPLQKIVEWYAKVKISINEATAAIQQLAEEQRRQIERAITPGLGLMPTVSQAQTQLEAFRKNISLLGIGIPEDQMPTVDLIMKIADALWRQGFTFPIVEAMRRLGAGFGIPGYAEGGLVTRPTLAMLGERGPEAIIPLNRAGGIVINFNAPVYGMDDFERQVAAAWLRTTRRGGFAGAL